MSLEDPHFFRGEVGLQSLLDSYPAFKKALMGVKHCLSLIQFCSQGCIFKFDDPRIEINYLLNY